MLTRWWKGSPVAAGLAIIVGISALALIAAYIAQYGYGLQPCELCLFQRYPFMAVIALAAIGWLVPYRFGKQIVMLLIGVTLLLNTAIAAYHSGVEQHWWPGPASCTETTTYDSIESLRAALRTTAVVQCDEPALEVLGVTMASANFLLSLLLCGFAFLSLSRSDMLVDR